MVTETASWLEVIWTSIALVAFVFTVYHTIDAITDLLALQLLDPNPVAVFVTRGGLFRQGTRLTIIVVLIISGIISLLTPPSNPLVPFSRLAITQTIANTIISCMMLAVAVHDRRERRSLIDRELDMQRGHPVPKDVV